MIEISTILFTLLIEGFIALLIVLAVSVFILYKRKKRDKASAQKLVKQIKQQSKVRLEKTGSFLNEKYRFDGNELKKAVKCIDKAEKIFMQKIIDVYLQRDSHGLETMDAGVAELIETYKELSPVMPDAEMLAEMSTGGSAQTEELNNLTEANEKLEEELSITKKTMGNMISEFGNMFGGGVENQLEKEEIFEKFNETLEKNESEDVDLNKTTEQRDEVPVEEPNDQNVQLDTIENEEIAIDDMDDLSNHEDLMDDLASEEFVEDAQVDTIDDKKKKEAVKSAEVFDEGMDDLMDGIDLSEDI